MKIEILCTGDEILSGKTVNTNYSHMARRLVEHGFAVQWGTVVGDHRDDLQRAFVEAGGRADVVIVNGGLGPTVDDLSQEVAATAAGVELVLHQEWLSRMDAWYQARGRTMPANNTKQAMLPEGAEFIDNPVGTACGFAVDIGKGRFYFTPGVPREMKRMLDDQIIPRLEQLRGSSQVTLLKRFHSFGIGESRADQMLSDAEDIVPGGVVKLGFQSHFPQLETKLTLHGENPGKLQQVIEPVVAYVRDKLGSFVLAEDGETLEGNIVTALEEKNQSLAVMEMHTAGSIVGRLMRSGSGASHIKLGLVSEQLNELFDAVGLPDQDRNPVNKESAQQLATALCRQSGARVGLAVLSKPAAQNELGEARTDIVIAIAEGDAVVVREAQFPGNKEWLRLGATELGLDCLRRYIYGLPVYQRIDFEQH